MPLTSARVAGTIAAAVPLRQPLLPVSLGPALQSPRPRAAPLIITAIRMVTMAAAPCITGAVRSITAEVRLITADMAMGAWPTTAALPLPVGERKFAQPV